MENGVFLWREKREYVWLKTLDRIMRETLTEGMIAFDGQNTIVTGSRSALAAWGVSLDAIMGKRLEQTEFSAICPDIRPFLEQNATGTTASQFLAQLKLPNRETTQISATLLPMITKDGDRVGTLLYTEDVTSNEKLRKAIEDLENTAQELHSANEELETTNEELQSTNEELETTNEELQSTNEELETTNEELHSLNEELETTNEALEMRTRELETASMRYQDTLRHLPVPLLLVNGKSEVLLWNTAAERSLGIAARAVVGARLSELPFPAAFRNTLRRRVGLVLENQRQSEVDLAVVFAGVPMRVNVHMTPVNNPEPNCVLVSFPVITKAPGSNGRANGGRVNGSSRKTALKNNKTSAKKKSTGARKRR